MNYDEENPHSHSMSLRQIEVFRAIMMTGSVSEAARSLYVAQPSVSRVLQVTEARLGFSLFERSRGRLFPTPEAKKIFEEIERAYEGIERVDNLVRSLIEGRSGELKVVCSPSLAVHLLPRTIARFIADFPNLPIHFEPLTHNHLVPRVLFGKTQIGVSMFEIQHPSIVATPLVSTPLYCVAGKGKLPRKRSIEMRDIANLPWIDYDQDTPLGRLVGQFFRNDPRPAPAVRVRSAISACTLAREGVGVAIVDPFCIDESARQVLDVVPLQTDHRLHASVLHPHAEPLSNTARRFVDVMRDVLENHLASTRTP
ncbi:LysR substrate-binding domain-containing protein [Burkholderia cepacia]|uniref:LysR substrate-binding domain-containing protein n=1 Tax=Burkholderia cepacia TaxID=292 RepID=UPI001588CEB3|nr:LysR substrate-binding domain-containing protein [Burkholderia cepacia]